MVAASACAPRCSKLLLGYRIVTGAAAAAPVFWQGDAFLLRIWRATLNSWAGLKAAANSEAAFREEVVALLLAVPLAFFLTPFAWKRLTLIGVILGLMVVELLNTAIEKLSDHVTATQHPDIGRIKDMASAAVGIALAIAGFTWLLAIAEWVGLLAWLAERI
jgi:diacylglycerol kinase (ATP)